MYLLDELGSKYNSFIFIVAYLDKVFHVARGLFYASNMCGS
jgi:hypothetical protein